MVEVTSNDNTNVLQTCIDVFKGDLSKMASFWPFHMNQQIAVAPTSICFLHLRPSASNQLVNILLILVGLYILKVTCNALHRNLA
jgi:hypothetical protein